MWYLDLVMVLALVLWALGLWGSGALALWCSGAVGTAKAEWKGLAKPVRESEALSLGAVCLFLI